jgi:hypothetical protein
MEEVTTKKSSREFQAPSLAFQEEKGKLKTQPQAMIDGLSDGLIILAAR